jgi:KDO2-lipid IV(A) lauroyltransferase
MKIIYHLIHFLWYALSLLPLRVLYWLSDVLFVFIYHVFGYRRSVVLAAGSH